jgi:hypothetical protein
MPMEVCKFGNLNDQSKILVKFSIDEAICHFQQPFNRIPKIYPSSNEWGTDEFRLKELITKALELDEVSGSANTNMTLDLNSRYFIKMN